MSKKYKVFLGSNTGMNYDECVEFELERAMPLEGKGYYDINEDADKDFTLKGRLDSIQSNLFNTFFAISGIGLMHESKASCDLLLYADVKSFKQDAYVGAKLNILSSEKPSSWISGYNTYAFFLPLMSDNRELIDYIASFVDILEAPYKRTDTEYFFLMNTILAVAGEWERLKPRAKQFIDEPKKSRA